MRKEQSYYSTAKPSIASYNTQKLQALVGRNDTGALHER